MSYKPDEKDWMAYLYGEMDEEDQRKFDQYILEHPEAQQELAKFRKLREILAGAGDKEVIAPPIVISDNPSAAAGRQRYFLNAPYVRMIASIAASVILIILVGRLTDTRLTVTDHELRLTFGEMPQQRESDREPMLSAGEVQDMINASLQENNKVMQASLGETQRKLDASIRNNLAQSSGKIDELLREASSASQEQVRQFVDAIRAENMQQVKDYFQLTSTEQKKYIENLLVDFAQYLQQQRTNDLQLVQTRMNSLEQNTHLFRQETEQILSSIITSVGKPVSDEIAN